MYVHMCEGHVKQLFLRSFASTDSIYQQSHLVKLWPLHLRLTKTKEWHTSSKDMAVCYRWDTHSVLTATPSPTAICLVRNINNIQLYAPHPTQQTSWIHTRPGRKAVKPSCKTSDAVEHSQHFHLLPHILGGGVPHGSQNPDPISYPFSDLTPKIYTPFQTWTQKSIPHFRQLASVCTMHHLKRSECPWSMSK